MRQISAQGNPPQIAESEHILQIGQIYFKIVPPQMGISPSEVPKSTLGSSSSVSMPKCCKNLSVVR